MAVIEDHQTLISPQRVAAIYGVPLHVVYRAIRVGKLRAYRVPGSQNLVVDIRDLPSEWQ